jgi:GH24 family phage-related lysozyme (muramidase)
MLNWNEIEDRRTYSSERADLLVLLEGSTLTPYVDTVGDPTIGIGFNLVYNLEPVLRVIVGAKNWSDTLLERLADEVEKSYSPDTSSAVQANLDRVMKVWHDTRNAAVPESFKFKNEAQVTKALNALAPDYDGRIDDWLAGIPDSREREALFSLCWNGPSLLGPKLKAAIEAGDRAEAWYEIRYNSNGNGISGLANRRYVEAETFGLFDTHDKATFAEALEAGQMLARHHEMVLWYEDRYDADKAGATKGLPGIDAIAGEMAPAIRTALKALGLSSTLSIEELLAAGKDGATVFGDGTSYDGGANDDDMILGSSGADTLSGDTGADILAGMKGADTLTGGSGADLFVFTSARDSRPDGADTIADFGKGADRLCFAKLGELTLLTAENATFSGAGDEIRWFRSGAATFVEVDLNGDGEAEMRLALEGRLTLGETDFLL